jgi:hypothetical protein
MTQNFFWQLFEIMLLHLETVLEFKIELFNKINYDCLFIPLDTSKST